MKIIYVFIFVYLYGCVISGQIQLGETIFGTNLGDDLGSNIELSADGRFILAASPKYDNNNKSKSGKVEFFEENQGNISLIESWEGDYMFGNLGSLIDLSSDGKSVAIKGNKGNDTNDFIVIYNLDNNNNNNNNFVLVGDTLFSKNLDEKFTDVSLSSDGKILAISVSLNLNSSSSLGIISIFNLTNGAWILDDKITTNISESPTSNISAQLNSDGTKILITNFRYTKELGQNGIANVYEKNDTWEQIGNDLFGEATGQRFGFDSSISSDGNRICITSMLKDVGLEDRTAVVEVFEFEGNEWNRIGDAYHGTPDLETLGFYGKISGNGQRFIIGERNYDSSRGRAFVYEYNGSDWIVLESDLLGINPLDGFGKSVSISEDGNRILIGAPQSSSGYVQLYELSETSTMNYEVAIDFDIFPNPSNGSFKLQGIDLVGSTFELIDQLGNIIIQRNEIYTSEIPLEYDLLSGIYYLCVRKEGAFSVRIIHVLK